MQKLSQAINRISPRRRRLRVEYELLVCGLVGHVLIGTDASRLRDNNESLIREINGVRWHRCLRCDSWVWLAIPDDPTRSLPPSRDEIMIPLRGRPLRDKIVLRLIAFDRALHFVALAVLAIAILFFVSHEGQLRQTFYQVINDVQAGLGGGPVQNSKGGLIPSLDRLFSFSSGTLELVAATVGAYALLEGIEAVGLWYQKRWAEYLTFVATAVFLPFEVHELLARLTWFRVLAFVINVAVVAYLLYAKRLFGLRGGGRKEAAERERDSGWHALEQSSPP
jgi:uncharacterized membrane protein (DUF2068 family)